MTTNDTNATNNKENAETTADDRDVVLEPEDANIPDNNHYEDVEDCEPLREGDEEWEMYPYGSMIRTPDDGQGSVECGIGEPTTMFIAVTGLTTDTLPESAVRQLTGQVHRYLGEDLGVRAESVSVVTDSQLFFANIDAPLSCPNCGFSFEGSEDG